ncbi:MAG: hypothetical protein EAZ57_00115 [Cytophagales bacterium]|nr:MAG: hypothetical protein EAZ67_04640 [Cytophagales bacterium]TAF62541.1 MAG: hypothetical protein EAZ57_00115 [Cytophagales bacterium]
MLIFLFFNKKYYIKLINKFFYKKFSQTTFKCFEAANTNFSEVPYCFSSTKKNQKAIFFAVASL